MSHIHSPPLMLTSESLSSYSFPLMISVASQIHLFGLCTNHLHVFCSHRTTKEEQRSGRWWNMAASSLKATVTSLGYRRFACAKKLMLSQQDSFSWLPDTSSQRMDIAPKQLHDDKMKQRREETLPMKDLTLLLPCLPAIKNPYPLLTQQKKLLPIHFNFFQLFDHINKQSNKPRKLKPRSRTVSLPACLCGSQALEPEGRKEKRFGH
eukprot:XP_017456616.1 PREDICTED: uncharacterized protein LOC108348808 [Rattus norvegicus]